MKEMTSVATTMMSEDEKAEIEREMNGGAGPTSPAPASVSPAPAPAAQPHDGEPSTAESTAPSSLAVSPGRSRPTRP